MIRMTWCCTKFALKSVETCVFKVETICYFKAVSNFLTHPWRWKAALLKDICIWGFRGRIGERESGLFVTRHLLGKAQPGPFLGMMTLRQ